MTSDLNIPKLIDKAALLVVDPQNDFLLPDAPLPCADAELFIKNTSLLVDKMRQRGVPIIYTREVHRPDGVDLGREADTQPLHCVEGTPGVDIVEELTPIKGDYVIDKRRFSAFFQTDLLGLLHGLGTKLLFITGGTADACVLCTVVDAYQYDYRTVTVGDCVFSTVGLLNEENFKDLFKLYHFYSNLMPLNRLLSQLETSS